FRVYENGEPAKIDNFLKFNANGPSDGELTFVSGSPGKTDRQLSLDELADTRDRYLPYVLRMFNRREVLETAYSARSFENATKTHDCCRALSPSAPSQMLNGSRNFAIARANLSSWSFSRLNRFMTITKYCA